jgi:hypothetical protein
MTGELHVAVGVMPNGVDISLDGDLRLVKSALLYGDRVTLYSPGASILSLMQHSIDRGPDTSDPEWLEHMEGTGPKAAAMVQTLRRLEDLRKKPHPTLDERIQLVAYELFQQELEETFRSQLAPEQEAMLGGAGFAELSLAVDAGLLSIAPIVNEDDKHRGDVLWDRAMQSLLERLGAVLTRRSTYPLFDSFIGALVRAGIEDGRFQPVDLVDAHGKQVGMASEFMRGLPAFGPATVAEIIDIRRHLEAPLIRFRAGLVELSERITSASFEENFSGEVEEIARAKVEPALLEINEEVQANAYLRQLVGHAVGDAKTLVGAALTFGIAQQLDLPSMLGASGGAALQASLAAALRQRKEADRIARHDLYFLYRTDQLLS